MHQLTIYETPKQRNDLKFTKMENTATQTVWKAKARRTNPDIYYSDKAINHKQCMELSCKAVGRITMGIMGNNQIIHSDDKEIGAHYDKEQNHIFIFQIGEELQFRK